MRVSAQSRLPHARQHLAERRVAGTVRSTSVFTKNPIRPSVSVRFRLATGVPTTTSSEPA
ncbi:hypothetical protein A4E84_04310 [Streptomyces qaidamensis]|uniref:Uncharacterized protein n=1 Tax=Streptomyces qaidamensis TaxID=1783515 RepID=A0A143BUH4_9ACTN|nr:hypothetical protein A4E84_04310 [Streptomyces qaidamensis]